MFTAVPVGTQPRRAPVVQEPALPAVDEEVIVTAFAAVSGSSENEFVPIAQGSVRHGVAADQGRRGHMEDATVAVPDFRDNLNQELAAQAPDANCFYGVFDGHSGAGAAHFARDHLCDYFAGYLQADNLEPDEMQEAMVQAFLRTDRELYSASHGPVGTNFAEGSGTTALTALIWGDQLIVANAGDCRAVLCRRGKAIDLSNDHRPCNPEEALRVKAAGGHICADGYLNGHLAVLRALGDHHFKDLKAPTGPDGAMEGPLLAEPEVALHTISPEDEFILMACDGLWDVFKSQRAVEFARQKLRDHNDPQLCSQQLVDEALRMNTSDNVSVITVCLTEAAPPKRTYSGRQSNVQRTMSQEGLSRLGSALMTADESITTVQL
ncbi:hypothetical protein WJX79_010487 [Trebouxia sp. C0005]